MGLPGPLPVVVQQDLVKRQGKPGTDEVVQEVWWGKKISTDHPSQPQGFGIGEMLTGGTSEGEVTPEEASISENSCTSRGMSKEPWTLVQKRKLGSKLKPAEDTEEKKRTDWSLLKPSENTEEKEKTDLPDKGGGHQ